MLEVKFPGAFGFMGFNEFINLLSVVFRLVELLLFFLLIFKPLYGEVFLFEFGSVVEVDREAFSFRG